MKVFNSILFVCVGNICRSPMAEGLYKYHLTNDFPDIKISSAGLHALVDRPAVKEAQSLMFDRGVDISSHRARQLTQKIALDSELILVMEDDHINAVERLSPSVRGRVFLLGRWGNYEIHDPYKMSYTDFEDSLRLIERSWKEWRDKL